MLNTIVPLDREGLELFPGGIHTFSLHGTPVLQEGKWMRTLGTTDDLWIHAKVYAEGGERDPHSHANEDHSFLVLQGLATFIFEGGHEVRVGAFEGVMIPRGGVYQFSSEGEENLVMVRIGAGHAPGPRGPGDMPMDAGLHANPDAIRNDEPSVVAGQTWPPS